MFHRIASVVAVCLLLVLSATTSDAASAAADWPQWRGPNRDGVAAAGPKLADSWPTNGPTLLWKSDPIPSSGNPSWATDGGAGSPVVADGRVFVYADVVKEYKITAKMMADWGWMEGVPDALATRIEAARVSHNRENLTGTNLDNYVTKFVATLDAADAQKFGDHARKRIAMGNDTAGWWGMTTLAGAGAVDKAFGKYSEWEKTSYKGKSFRDHDLINGHGDGGTGGNYIQGTLLRTATRVDTVFCLDATTGKTIWKKESSGQPAKSGLWYWFAGASGTPSVSKGKCYVAGEFGIYCLSAKDGKEIWKAKVPSASNSSPLVSNGMVYVLFGRHIDSNSDVPGELTAFNAETGAVVWRQPKVWSIHSSPVLWTGKDGKNALVCFAWGGPFLVDPKTGDVLCQLPSCVGYWTEYCTPVICGDTFVVVSGSKLIGYKIDYPKAEQIWATNAGGDDRGGSALAYQDHVYCFGRGNATCVDLKTGEIKWKGKSKNGESQSPVIADGKVFAHGGGWDSNTFKMYKLSPDAETVLGQTANLSCPFSSPAIAGGRMYIRTPDGVICYDLLAK